MLAGAGSFRLVDAPTHLGEGLLADSQFLTLRLVTMLSVGLVLLVFVATLFAGCGAVGAVNPFGEQFDGGVGYLLLRAIEADITVLGVSLMAATLPPLFAPATPAPASVGIMLLLLSVDIGILVTSFLRSGAELFVYSG